MDTDGTKLTGAFELVSHETRARILIELAEQQRYSPRDPSLNFSTLRKRVGHNDPGNFNYHLKRLSGTLVQSTGNGYRLSNIGHHFVAVLVSGQFDPHNEIQLEDDKVTCLVCNSKCAVSYRDGMIEVECKQGHEARLGIGPEVLSGRSAKAALDIALLKSLYQALLTRKGVCPICSGQTTHSLTINQGGGIDAVYKATCRQCGLFLQNHAAGTVMLHPTVVAFCYEHGYDVRREPWEIMSNLVCPIMITQRDPLRGQLEVGIENAALRLMLNESAEILEVSETG